MRGRDGTVLAAFFAKIMDILKKIRKFLSSMTFAIILLVLLGAACAFGSFIPQGQTYAWYAANYSESAAAWIMALQLYDTFHSVWFIAIALFLCGNLLLCNVLRLKSLIHRTKRFGDPKRILESEPNATVFNVSEPTEVFQRLSMPKPAETEKGTALYAAKNRIGLWGAWICHVGILLLIVGFGLGQMTKAEYTVYGVPGDTKPIGETGLMLSIDGFEIGLREDDTVEQYTASITVSDPSNGRSEHATISVNNPGRMFGMSFYQNATGWAANISVQKDGTVLQNETVCAGEMLEVKDLTGLTVVFYAFYPDYVYVPNVGPQTMSSALRNPAYLYALFYHDEMIGMNVLTGDETIRIDGYEIRFFDPQSYTLIQVKRESFTLLAFSGGLVTLLGLVLAFYVQPKSVWAIPDEDGTWTVYGSSTKRGILLQDELERAVKYKERHPSGGNNAAS